MKKTLFTMAALMTAMNVSASNHQDGMVVKHWLDMTATPVGCSVDIYKNGVGFSLEGKLEDGKYHVNIVNEQGNWQSLLTKKQYGKVTFAEAQTDDVLDLADGSNMQHHEERFGDVSKALKAFEKCIEGRSHEEDEHNHEM